VVREDQTVTSRTTCREPSTSSATTTTWSLPGLPAPVRISVSPSMGESVTGAIEYEATVVHLRSRDLRTLHFSVRTRKNFLSKHATNRRMSTASATIDQLLGTIASLPFEDQVLLHEVIGHRLVEARRLEIADEAVAARTALERGEVRRGTTADLFADLESDD
jgi:hypothetical protein